MCGAAKEPDTVEVEDQSAVVVEEDWTQTVVGAEGGG